MNPCNLDLTGLDPIIRERLDITVKAYGEHIVAYAALRAAFKGHPYTVTEEDIVWAKNQITHINPCDNCRYDKTKEYCRICSPCHPKYWDFKQ